MKYTMEILTNINNSLYQTMAGTFNKAWDAYNYNRTAWRNLGIEALFRNVWGKGFDCLLKAYRAAESAINDEDKEALAQARATLADYAQRFKNAATRFYAHESCWNPQLPQSLTKVLGHTYTCTEYVTQQTDMLADHIRMVAEHYRKAAMT